MPKEPPSQDVPQIHRTPRGIIVPLNSWQLLLRNIARGKHTLITGPTGTGKTTLAVDAAEECRRQYRMFYCGTIFDAEATVIGTPELRGGDTRFRPSRLIEAVQTPGCVLIFDELNRAMAAVHNAALSLLDWQGKIPVDADDGERRMVDRAPGVVVVATANIGAEYVQTEQLDAALLNRMLIVRLDFPEDEQRLVAEREVGPREAASLVQVTQEIRKAHVRGDLPATVSTRSLLEAAEMVHEGFGVEHAFESVVPVFDEPDLAKLRTIVRAVK